MSSSFPLKVRRKPCFVDWIGRIIRITTSKPPKSWRLERKCSERNDQEYVLVDHDPGIGQGLSKGAVGKFKCRNVADDREVAVMTILMDVPYFDAECPYHAECNQQDESLQPNIRMSKVGHRELELLRILQINGVRWTPHIQNLQAATQGPNEPVPGRNIFYVLIDHVDGVELNRALFWSLPRDERDRIRKAFRIAWLDCVEYALISPHHCHIFWDAESSKVSFVGLRDSSSGPPKDQWANWKWSLWELAALPPGANHTQIFSNPETSGWIL
ncbi:uncharacterized protein BDV14DRAFT_201621 [Aspergillus stella-maris]|uniref:uncharacterized protein n=1 Tax=Aspergillus stella-maris TaxID=1810926 RepID=UPI003CCCD617